MAKKINLEPGIRFGRLKTMGESESRNYKVYEKCICNCGNVLWVLRSNLLRGKSNSCGCLRKELTITRSNTHGMAGTRIYKIYHEIRRRCECNKQTSYKYYGGKGIRCERETFEDFYKDMGESYKNHVKKYGERDTTIDRINSDLNYCKENCKWATRKEQNTNKENIRKIMYKGKCYVGIKNLCDSLGLNYKLIRYRLEKGWMVDEAVETPKNGRYKHITK